MNRLPVAAIGPLATLCLLPASHPDAHGAAATSQPLVTVEIANSRSTPIYVSFTRQDQSAGTINWNSTGSGCTATGSGTHAAYTTIAANQTCTATIPTDNGSSRFCAALDAAPANCMNAQTEHLTMVETNFVASDQCFGTNVPCVWYDISVIPSTCTDALWDSDQCKGTGGASYNLPVSLSCAGNPAMPVYTCQGPTNTTYGPENYPSNCGNPNGTCAVGTPKCTDGVAAYFYPMFDPPENAHQPNAVCVKGTGAGAVLSVDFLSGQ